MPLPDIAIAGAGLIGLSLALRLADAGLRVAVFTAADPLAEASTAAAGMLAVEDPHNPAALLPLSRFSRALYPAFLDRLNRASGPSPTSRLTPPLTPPLIPQTTRTLQQFPTGSDRVPVAPDLLPSGLRLEGDSPFALLEEWSLDPRELAAALLAAVRDASIALHLHSAVLRFTETSTGVTLHTAQGTHTAAAFIDCTGAWSLSSTHFPELLVSPRKGQMLTVSTPPALAARPVVLRTEHIYAVPRVHGPRAGQTVIGASVEDRGFSRTVEPATLQSLQHAAAALLPELAAAPVRESWAGLRPATADALPLLGRLPGLEHSFIASGHYRNGILLAPGTAAVLADLLLGREPAISLQAFAPQRLLPTAQPCR